MKQTAAEISGETPHIHVERLALGDTVSVLPNLQVILDGAYHDSHMYQDLAEDLSQEPDPFQLFLARSGDQKDTVMGVAVVESKIHPAFDYLDFPPIHVKRFTVAEAARGKRIGKLLLDDAKRYGFEDLGLSAIFGESNEIGALSMYGREGALYSSEAISEYWRRNTPEQGMSYFAMDLSDPKRRGERYPSGEGIRFVFAGDKQTAQFFREHGYVSKDEVLANTAS